MPCEEWSTTEESALVRAAASGDIYAFDQLARRYRPAALMLARQILKRQEGAEDVVQDALISAYKGLPRLQDADRFAAWLSRIVRNRALKELSGPSVPSEPLSEHVDRLILKSIPAICESAPLSDEAATKLLACLPEETREIANLYYLLEWPVARIAALFGLTTTTVKWRLHTARKLLRRRHTTITEPT